MDTNGINIKKTTKIIAIFIAFIFMSEKVYANDCTIADENSLRKEALTIEIIPDLNDNFNPMHDYYYNVNISNFSEKFKIVDTKENKISYYTGHTSESKYGMYVPGEKVVFKIYGAYGEKCSETLLATKTITFDYYNDYSQHEACNGIEDFALCKRNYSGKIKSEKWFLEKIEEYKKSLEKEQKESQKEEPFLQNILLFIRENIVVIIAVAVIVLIIMILTTIKFKRKKIKIDIGRRRLK